MFDIEPGADLNGNDGNPVTLTHAAEIFMDGSGASGPLTSTAGWLELSTHTLSVSGAANLNGQYGTLIAGPGDAGELTATGNVIVGGRFDLEQLPVNNDCAPLSVGTVYTLISTTGTVSGTFMNVPNGATVPMAIGCPRGQGLTTLARINYTPSAVTATIVAAPTVAELRASLRAVLKPHGRNSRIRRILKNGGYTYTLPPIAGHLVLTWLAKSHRKTVKIASVTADPDGAGPTKLKIVLTSHGRRVLARVSRLKVTGSAFFEPAATAFVALQPRATFTLRR
jgi:hypothetical protein